MAEFRNTNVNRGIAAGRAQVEIDEGLRAYMLKVYNYMSLAVALTGITALMVANMATTNDPSLAVATLGNGKMLTSLGATIYSPPLSYIFMFAPLAFVLVLSFGINKLSAATTQLVFWLYAAVMGISISSILLVYTGESIAQTFFVTSAAFACLSLYGYTTKKDLSAMGSFMVMGLFGIIIAMIVNLFLQSGALAFAINVLGVLIFAGLTAWDTQRIKQGYEMVAHSGELMAKGAIMGALSLYLDFVNMFLFLLSFLGNRD